ncbi:hypothetical protein BASA81_008468 [Batrachochytrium salamandrivorans]|nr:hypothetical protein BASA81_008468 [Batrachochytrium salamandrivorans]
MFSSAQVRFQIVIPAPYVNGREFAAAQEVMDSKLLCYDERLKGILLSYEALEGGEVGVFQDEQPDVFFPFTTKVMLYSPKEGEVFKATVSEISPAAVYLLAAGVFPITVPASAFPKDSSYSKSQGVKSLVSVADSSKLVVEVGHEYELKCVKVSTTANVQTIHVEATFQL